MMPATSNWLAAFTVWPDPVSPTCTMVLPMASRTDRAAATSSASPPTMIDSEPSMAPASPPLTGASRTRTPLALAASVTASEVAGAIVLMSMSSRPSLAASSTPSGPRTTASTSGESGSMVITTSAPRVASAMLEAGFAPA